LLSEHIVVPALSILFNGLTVGPKLVPNLELLVELFDFWDGSRWDAEGLLVRGVVA